MRKLMMATIVAMVLASSVPAMAQSFSVGNSGPYAEQCVAGQQPSNQGNVESNAPTSDQQYSVMDDFEAGGTTLNFEPWLENACDQSVEQDSSASAS